MASGLKIPSALRHTSFKNPHRILNPPYPSIGYLQKIPIVTVTPKYPQFSPRFPKIHLHYYPPLETLLTPHREIALKSSFQQNTPNPQRKNLLFILPTTEATKTREY
ncbi:MAG: hypothetical protein WC502_10795 [Methanolinea sp.]